MHRFICITTRNSWWNHDYVVQRNSPERHVKSDFVHQGTTHLSPWKMWFERLMAWLQVTPPPPPRDGLRASAHILTDSSHDRNRQAEYCHHFPSNVANTRSHGTTLSASRMHPSVLREDIHPWRSPFSRPSCCVFRWWANKRNFYATRKAATCNDFIPKHLHDELRATGVGLTNKIRLQLTG